MNKVEELRAALAWCIEQFRGESGAGESYWQGQPGYQSAVRALEDSDKDKVLHHPEYLEVKN